MAAQAVKSHSKALARKSKAPVVVEPLDLSKFGGFQILDIGELMAKGIGAEADRAKLAQELEPKYDKLRVSYFKASKVLNVDLNKLAEAMDFIFRVMHEEKVTSDQAMHVLAGPEGCNHN